MDMNIVNKLGSLTRYKYNSQDQQSGVPVVVVLDNMNTNKLDLDEVIALRDINKDIVETILDCSISRFISSIVNEKTFKFTDLEIQALDLLNRVLTMNGDDGVIKTHEVFVMDSVTSSLYTTSSKREKRYTKSFNSYAPNREVDVTLSNNGSRVYHSYIKLFLALACSIYRGNKF